MIQCWVSMYSRRHDTGIPFVALWVPHSICIFGWWVFPCKQCFGFTRGGISRVGPELCMGPDSRKSFGSRGDSNGHHS